MTRSFGHFLSVVAIAIAGVLADPSSGNAQWSWFDDWYGSTYTVGYYPYSYNYYPYSVGYYPYSVAYVPSYTAYYAGSCCQSPSCCAAPSCCTSACSSCGGCQACGAESRYGCGAGCGVAAVQRTLKISPQFAQRTFATNRRSQLRPRSIQVAAVSRGERSQRPQIESRRTNRALQLQDRPTWRLSAVETLMNQRIATEMSPLPNRVKSRRINSLNVTAESQLALKQ
jgi:hypothetical protein